MTITTKIAKNGAVNIYLDGKRVKEEIAVDTLCDNGGKIYFADIHGYTGHTITATFASSISAYKWLIKMGNKSINYADGSWLIDCKDYKTGEIVTILEKDERDYVINDPQLKAFCNGEILEVTQEVVTDDAEQEPEVAKFEVGKTYFVILDGQTITVKVEDRTAKMLTATTNEGTRKYHIHETIDAEHINLNGEGLMIWAQCEFTTQNVNAAKAELQADTDPEVDPIIQERETARNEYDQLNEARKVIENDVEKFERLRNRCKSGSTKRREYYQLLESFKPILRAFGEKYIAALDRYNKSLTLRTDEEKAATQKAIDEHNAEIQNANTAKINDLKWEIRYVEGSINDLDKNHLAHFPQDQSLQERRAELVNELAALKAQLAEIEPANTPEADHTTGIKEENAMTNRDKFLKVAKVIKCEENITNAKCWYYNTLADIDTEHWKRISKARANEILFCYGLTADSFLAEQNLINEETRKRNLEKFALKKIVHPRTIKAQADFYADKVKRESKPLDNENVFDLLPDLDNDVEKVWLTKGELDDLTAKFRAAVSIIPVTTRIEKMLPVTIKITKQNSAKPFDMGFGAFAKYSIVQWITGLRIMRNFSTLGRYDTPAQVEKVIDLLKAAITRGDKAFTFPTVEELDPNPDDELIDPPAEIYDICNQALKEVA